MKNLINIKSLKTEEIINLLDFADEIKAMDLRGQRFKPLEGKTVITSFPPTSMRTRISFETGIFQLGANAINMVIDFEGKEPLEDKVGYLNCWIDYLVIRYKSEEVIKNISKLSKFSVVNAMSRLSHPCEILSDLHSIRERRGSLQNLKFVFVGEGANICNTWFEAAGKLDLNLTQICPEGYEITKELFDYAKNNSNGDIKVTNNIEKGLKNADIILTDGWPTDSEEDLRKFLPYQLTLDKIKVADKNCIVNPCPPFTRCNEITDEIIASKRFIGYECKESLLYMQKAILARLSS